MSARQRLVNVRLDPARVRKAQVLRERGFSLSDIVRQAIDERFEGLQDPEGGIDIRETIQRAFEQHPDPPDLPSRRYSVHNRRAARAAIRRKLRTPRS